VIIDAHTHLYPPEAAENPVAWADKRGEGAWSACVAPADGPNLQGWSDAKTLFGDMRAAGVEQAWILGWYWENPDTCHEANEWHAAACKLAPQGRLRRFAAFNAREGKGALEALAKELDRGALGIGELNPSAQGYAYDDPILDAALELAAERGRPVNVHVTEPLGRPYPGKIETPFDALQAMVERHPDTRFVFAHLGGLLPFHERARSMRKAFANVLYDTAAVPLLYRRSIYRLVCDAVGPERLLFGTDYPLRTFPRRLDKPDFAAHLADLRDAGLAPAELAPILSGNARRLLEAASPAPGAGEASSPTPAPGAQP